MDLPECLPDAIQLLVVQLNSALNAEAKYQAFLQLPLDQHPGDSVTVGIRDGSANVLRCLKVWYDLPSDVLFVAINVMDRFLTKMKARPRHMACLSVSSFLLAARHVSHHRPIDVPAACDIAVISQCKCTLGDLERMEGVIADKLGADPTLLPVTPLDFLSLFAGLFACMADGLGLRAALDRAMPAAWLGLEVLACDAACSNFRACEIALALACARLDAPPLQRLGAFIAQLQKMCNIPDSSFFCCQEVVLSILARYDAQCQTPHRQRLVWRLSQRTLRYLRPTDKLTSMLPTIREDKQLQILLRARSGSVSSEESFEDSEKEEAVMADWNPPASSLAPAEWSQAAMLPLTEEDEYPA